MFRLLTCIAMLFACSTCLATDNQDARRVRKKFTGQLVGLVGDLKEAVDADPLLKDSKFQLGKVTTEIPDSNFELEVVRLLQSLLVDRLSDDSSFFISGEYNFIEGTETDNKGLDVVELVVKVTDRRGKVLQKKRREVNETDDIVKLTSLTVSVPDTDDIHERNKMIEEAFDHPAFEIVGGTQVASKGNPKYTVEIMVKRGGTGELEPLTPTDNGGMAFVPLAVTDTFVIVVRNYDTTCSAVADVRIDGLSVVNTFCEDKVTDAEGNVVGYPGYLIDKAASGSMPGAHAIQGWLRTAEQPEDNVFEFVISEFGKGAASALKSQAPRGVITVQFLQAAKPNESLRGRSFGEVGKGQTTSVDYELVPIQLLDVAESTVNIRYSIPQ